MKSQLFQDLVLSSASGKGRRRTRGLPYSLALHGAALGALLLLPLLGEDRLPFPEPDVFKGPVVYAASLPAGGGNPAPRSRVPGRSVPVRSARPSFVPPSENPVPEPPGPTGTLEPSLVGACFGDECEGEGGGTRPGPGGAPGIDSNEPPPARVVRVGTDVQPPTKVHDLAPVYPHLAKRIGVQGIVIVECMIAPNGRVVDARVVSGHLLLDQAALDAVNRWVYTPTRVNGVPVAVLMTVTVKFQLR